MPCEVALRIVNNTYSNIAKELEVNSPQKGKMYEQKLEFCRPATPFEKGRPLNGKLVEKCWQEEVEMTESSTKKSNQEVQEISYQVYGYRSLPRVFLGLGEFGVIEETESADDECVSQRLSSVPLLQQSNTLPRKSTASDATKENLGAHWLASSSTKNNLRRSSEGSLYVVSAPEDSRSGEYQDYSEPILRTQRSEREVSTAVRQSLVNGSSRRASLTAMNVIPETLSDSRRYYSLPRKLSLPIESRSSVSFNGKKQRNSFPANADDTDTFALDTDTEIQWEMLVARAKHFQKISSKDTSRKSSAEDVKMRKDRRDFESQSVGQDRGSIADRQVSKVNLKENHESKTKNSHEKLKESIKSSAEIESKECSSVPLVTEKEAANPGQDELTVKNVSTRKHDFEAQLQTNRRYSLATVGHSPEIREKISGYSTHGALEYAKMLLGKIQSEGKSKSKKERLEDMSKALKLVLEELNRIDLPDRELVSLFISLRAKIVNLKAELKAEETHVLPKTDKERESEARVLMSQTLPRVRSTSESVMTRPNFRRFSWC